MRVRARAAAASVTAALAAAVTGTLVVPAPAGAETVQLVLDCTVGGTPVNYTLPFASRASAWVPEGGTATMAIDPVVQTLPSSAPNAPGVVGSYDNVTLRMVATGGTIGTATLADGGTGLGAAAPTVDVTDTTVSLVIPGPIAADAEFIPPALSIELRATAPAGGALRLVPATAFYSAVARSSADPTLVADATCFPQDPALATTTIPVIGPDSPPAPPLPPAPPPSPVEPPLPPGPPVTGAGRIVPLAPQRLIDTRDGTGAAVGSVAAGTAVRVVARGVAGIPADASAVVLNVTATEADGDGFVAAYPCGGPVPVVSNVNYAARTTVPNLATVPLAADGTVCLFTYERAHLLADVAGAVVPGGDFYTGTSPVRLADTRDGTGVTEIRRLEVGEELAVTVAGRAGAPTDATAAVANLTVSQPAAAGFLSAFPCGQAPPNSSNLNFVAGQTVSNLALARLGTGGRLCIVVSAATNVVVDLSGWTAPGAGATFGLVEPTRVVDTRRTGARLAAGGVLRLSTADLGAAAPARRPWWPT